MVLRSALSDLVFLGISSVNLIFGYVMNVKFRKILRTWNLGHDINIYFEFRISEDLKSQVHVCYCHFTVHGFLV
jgi:hypothetical protein